MIIKPVALQIEGSLSSEISLGVITKKGVFLLPPLPKNEDTRISVIIPDTEIYYNAGQKFLLTLNPSLISGNLRLNVSIEENGLFPFNARIRGATETDLVVIIRETKTKGVYSIVIVKDYLAIKPAFGWIWYDVN